MCIRDSDPSEADAGASAPGEASIHLAEGVTGADQDSPNPAKRQIAQRSDVEQRARAEAIEQAATAGILGSTMINTAFAAYGSDMVSSGFDVMDAIGGYDGDGIGAPRGFGDGVLGKGPGAGGDFGTNRSGGYITDGLRQRGDDFDGGGRGGERTCGHGGLLAVAWPRDPGWTAASATWTWVGAATPPPGDHHVRTSAHLLCPRHRSRRHAG